MLVEVPPAQMAFRNKRAKKKEHRSRRTVHGPQGPLAARRLAYPLFDWRCRHGLPRVKLRPWVQGTQRGDPPDNPGGPARRGNAVWKNLAG